MAFCTNCGTENKNNSKFCPNCGTEITVDSHKSRRRPPPKRKMQKGVVKSLQDQVPKTTEKKMKDYFFSDNSDQFVDSSPPSNQNFDSLDGFSEENTDYSQGKEKVKDSLKGKLLGFYVILNILLVLFSAGNEMLAGYMIYSLIIIIVISIRIKKEKTFNWVLKILIVLQILSSISILVLSLDSYSYLLNTIAALALIGLLVVKVLMLLKGNK